MSIPKRSGDNYSEPIGAVWPELCRAADASTRPGYAFRREGTEGRLR